MTDDYDRETLAAVAEVMAGHLLDAVRAITSAAWCQRAFGVTTENLIDHAVVLHDYAHDIKTALHTEDNHGSTPETE